MGRRISAWTLSTGLLTPRSAATESGLTVCLVWRPQFET
jgi:hypothetical protein